MRLLLITATLVAALLPSALLASTAIEQEADASAPEVPLLRARVKEFWHVVGAHDLDKRYEMTTPTVRRWLSLDSFKQTWRWQERPEFPVQTIKAELVKICSCVKLQLLRCTVVVDLAFQEAGESPRVARTLQTWEFAGGQWYEGYSGAPIGRRCPGEG